MSLVICSNTESDVETTARKQSIFKAFSFRNSLSSTFELPENCQVALQSCKINLDGTVSVGDDSRIMFQYFGGYVNTDVVADADTIEGTTGSPIRTPLFDDIQGVKDLSAEDLATEIQKAMNKYIYHPNLKSLCKCEVKRNAGTFEFEGFEFTYEQNNTLATTIPPTGKDRNAYYPRIQDGRDLAFKNYTYTGTNGSFTTTNYNKRTSAVVFNVPPLSRSSGVFEVDISGCMNASHCRFSVGLGRASPVVSYDDKFNPPYYRFNRGIDFDSALPAFIDFGISCGIRGNGADRNIRLVHTPVRSDLRRGLAGSRNYTRFPTRTFLDYTTPAPGGVNGSFTALYNAQTNASAIDRVRFTVDGETVNVDLVDSVTPKVYKLCHYNVAANKESNIKPLGQSCWNLHPILQIKTTPGSAAHEMAITEYNGMNANYPLDDYDFTKITKGGWSEAATLSGDSDVVLDFENRPWNDYGNASNAPNPLGLSTVDVNGRYSVQNPVLVLTPSNLYTPSFGANTHLLLGFGSIPVDTGWDTTTDKTWIKASTAIPKLLSTKSIFVRLENFTQQSLNARQGNRSSIIAHLPRFDGQNETGRLFFQPSQMIFLDLNNSEPIKLNSFDISFVYSNEQYAEAIVGQSIVALYFRKKPN